MDSVREKYADEQIDCYFCGEPCVGTKYREWTELTHEGQVIALHPLCNPYVLPDGRLRCAVCKSRPAKAHGILCGSKKCHSAALAANDGAVQMWPTDPRYPRYGVAPQPKPRGLFANYDPKPISQRREDNHQS